MIAKAVSLAKCAGGPSHFDSDQFCHVLLSKKFKAEASLMIFQGTSLPNADEIKEATKFITQK